MTAASPIRGHLIDIGGRRLRLVVAGPERQVGRPTVLLEAGAFGFSADWAEVQERLAGHGLRSIAYDRAGLGRSDPGPSPRDGEAVLADLERLLIAAGETPPYLLVGHSMAGLRVQLFAARHPDKVCGVVLVDASTPEATDGRLGRAYLDVFKSASRVTAGLAGAGILKPLTPLGDTIGLKGPAQREKQWAIANGPHGHAAAQEVDQWTALASQARAAGGFPPHLPVAVVTAGKGNDGHPIKALQVRPAHAAARRYVKHVEKANHASLLGHRHADEIVSAVLWVLNP